MTLYKDMLCLRRWSDAGPAGRVRCWLVQCREPKTGQQKVQLYYEDDPLCPSSYCILFIYVVHSVNIIVYKYAHFGVSTIVSFPIFFLFLTYYVHYFNMEYTVCRNERENKHNNRKQ